MFSTAPELRGRTRSPSGNQTAARALTESRRTSTQRPACRRMTNRTEEEEEEGSEGDGLSETARVRDTRLDVFLTWVEGHQGTPIVFERFPSQYAAAVKTLLCCCDMVGLLLK